ncbi:hypothetical protein C2845_PM03G22690 [Panicum miliaceum]|uniref:F-box domain-containing protein n=1 Tax=Panicum miliaceum TaxID=4540 RepID=A0A3L6TDV8_PANMI|nr:hypothetical protein C2845_PM03G22690 [Panicum miliaceum]
MGSVLGRRRNGKPDVLPADVIYEVLLRLPANVLCRLRLVCRSWRSFTSDPSFARAHSSRHLLIAGLHAHRGEVHIADLSGNIIKRIPISRSNFSDDLSTHRDTICVCVSRFHNQPSFVLRHKAAAGEVITLPEFRCFRSVSILAHVPSTGEHKVLRIVRYFETHGFVQPTTYVTTLDGGGAAGRWRAGPCLEVLVEPTFRHRAVVGGVAYFLLGVFWTHHHTNFADIDPANIASFDLEKEEWRTTMIWGPLTELGGSLAMVHSKFEERVVDVWFPVDLGKGTWSKCYSLQCASDPVHCRFLYPIAILGDGRIVAWMDFDRGMRIYDPRTSAWASAMVVTGEKYIAVAVVGVAADGSGRHNIGRSQVAPQSATELELGEFRSHFFLALSKVMVQRKHIINFQDTFSKPFTGISRTSETKV